MLCILNSVGLQAQVPGTLSYQGILLTTDGITPLSDGQHNIEFRFYNAASVYQFSKGVRVETAKGLFTCLIGTGLNSFSGFNNSPLNASQIGGEQFTIGIKVDVDDDGNLSEETELSPRAQLTPAAYAFQAQSAYTISDNAVTSNKIADGSIVNADINSIAAIVGTKIIPNFGSQDILTTGKAGVGVTTPVNRLDVEGAAAIGASYSGSTTAPSNGLLVQGNVGIGSVSTTTHHLTVAGVAKFETSAPYLDFYETDAPYTTNYFRAVKDGDRFQVRINNVFDPAPLTITSGGNMGIGTATPLTTLDIAGTLSIEDLGSTLDLSPGGSIDLNATNRSFLRINIPSVFSGSVALSATESISNGTRVGQILILEGKRQLGITIPDDSNVQLAGNTDYDMRTNDTLTLIWDGTDWIEIGRSNN